MSWKNTQRYKPQKMRIGGTQANEGHRVQYTCGLSWNSATEKKNKNIIKLC